MLDLRGVTVRFGRGRSALTAVDRVDLAVPAGAVVGLVGESGSGKTSLARAAVGLAPLAGGQVLLDGARLPRRPPFPLQLVFQDPYSSLDPRMTVGETIAEAMPGRPGRRERAAEVRRLLELVDLDPGHAGSLPASLSGGQRQRVALARALAGRPRYLIADEITSALDVSVQAAVLNLVRDLQHRLGIGMLVISHNLAVVRYLSDVIAVMYLGRVVEQGPATAVLAAPQHPYTRTLLAAAPRLGGSLDDEPDALDPDPPDPHHPPPGCHFHRRCPVGPMVRADRAVCTRDDPQAGAAGRRHQSACHFADAIEGSPHEYATEGRGPLPAGGAG